MKPADCDLRRSTIRGEHHAEKETVYDGFLFDRFRLEPLHTTGTTLRQQVRQGRLLMSNNWDRRKRYQPDLQPLMHTYGPQVIDQIVMLALMMPDLSTEGTR